jgi:hypothetical protein
LLAQNYQALFKKMKVVSMLQETPLGKTNFSLR